MLQPFKRRLVVPMRIETWSLTTLQQRLVKTSGRLINMPATYWLLLAESHLARRQFASMLWKDRGATVAGGIRRVQSGADLDNDAGAQEVSAEPFGEGPAPGVAYQSDAKPPLPATPLETAKTNTL